MSTVVLDVMLWEFCASTGALRRVPREDRHFTSDKHRTLSGVFSSKDRPANITQQSFEFPLHRHASRLSANPMWQSVDREYTSNIRWNIRNNVR
eukprot:6841916-Pyramimonas_sp.AAC.1